MSDETHEPQDELMAQRFKDQLPRPPTEHEVRAIISRYRKEYPTVEDTDLAVRNAYIAVFPDYCTSSPGYAGKVIVIVWDGSPNFVTVYTVKDGDLVEEVPEELAAAQQELEEMRRRA